MIELWRGNANAWECDELGHLNVRFYLAKAMEAVANLADEAGLTGAFTARATATLVPSEIHIRFLAESRPGAPLEICGGFTEIGESEARLSLVMSHAGDGRPAATFGLTLFHADPRSGRIFAWPKRFHQRAGALRIEAPDFARPRGVRPAPWDDAVSLDRAEAMGLRTIGRGRFNPREMDVFGRLLPELFLGRVSDSVVHFEDVFPEEYAFHSGKSQARISGALLECRIKPRRWPRAGDGYVIRSGLAAAGEKVRTLVHWVLDPATGRPWWTMEGVACAMDLDARKLAPATGETLKTLQNAVKSNLFP